MPSPFPFETLPNQTQMVYNPGRPRVFHISTEGPPMIGKTLAHYEILAKIGQGGMGEVYRALDTKLDREIALKVLPADMDHDSSRLERFEREAKAVAALKHPNIVTIHSVEEVDGIHFLTMELVEGRRLSSLLPKGGFPLERIFDIAIPLADAVSSAHARGITHRDLKPDNIMIDDEGRLRVLDFGLAKLQDPSDPGESTLALTVDAVTEEGKILGTVAYMSPEQAEGKPIDSRSDIFSLGTVLYEMVTGVLPFQGDTGISTIGAILKDDPATVTELNLALPRHLGRIIRRCLAKQPGRRYQTAIDLRNDLEGLKEEMDSGEIPQASAVSMAGASRFTGRRLAVGSAVIAMGIIGITFAMYKFLPRDVESPGKTPSSSQMEMTRLTFTGESGYAAAISPDGKYVVHIQDGEEGNSLWLFQVSTARRVQVVEPTRATLSKPTISPDGDLIYYLKKEENAPYSSLFSIPLLGGPATRVLENIRQKPSFSPDGGHFVFLRDDDTLDDLLMVADLDGGNQRELARRAPPLEYHRNPVWSPDGKVVVVSATGFGHKDFHLAEVPVAGGNERILTTEAWGHIENLEWLPDGSGLIMQAYKKVGNRDFQIWEVPYPDGVPRRITNDFYNYSGVSLTADGKTLVTQLMENENSLWATKTEKNFEPVQITAGGAGKSVSGISWTRDGRIVFGATSVEGEDLWLSGMGGGKPTQLTQGGTNAYPSVSPDGRYIVYGSTSSHQPHIWRIDFDGGNPTQLTFGEGEYHPQCHPDGVSVYFLEETSGGYALFKVPLLGGETVLVSERTLANRPPALSPDGNKVGVRSYDESLNQWRIDIFQIDGGGMARTFDLDERFFQWSPSGDALDYSKWVGNAENIWSQPLNDDPPVQLTYFKTELIPYFSWAPDGKHLAVERLNNKWDVVLLKNFR